MLVDSPKRKLTDERRQPVAPPACLWHQHRVSCPLFFCRALASVMPAPFSVPPFCGSPASPKPLRAHTKPPPELPFLPGGYLRGITKLCQHSCITEHQKPCLKPALFCRVPRFIFPLLSYLWSREVTQM